MFLRGGGNRAPLASLATIGPLQDNGGPTPTHALLAGSTAIFDVGPHVDCPGSDAGAALTVDQCGYTRVAGSTCDAGAYEYGGVPPTATAIEYRHAAFDHYFVTAIADEIGKLDAGTIAGWTRTGFSFNVYADKAANLAGVCRFFSAAFAPKSSHFYTPSAAECATVKNNPDWTFEAVVFYMVPADANGACAAGTQPVYRLYNNGQGAAPNHRYTTRLAVRAQMLAAGWIAEGYGKDGVIMCAPAT